MATMLLALSACGSDVERPRAPGSGRDDIRRSPCACEQLLRGLTPLDERERLHREIFGGGNA